MEKNFSPFYFFLSCSLFYLLYSSLYFSQSTRDACTCNRRCCFTDHFYTALSDARYRTFRDDDELKRGQDLASELERAIRQSKISIDVFSKDYAYSIGCLDKLVNIADDDMVLPVFCHVEAALREAANLARFLVNNQTNRHEVQLLKSIVEDIGRKLNKLNPTVLREEELDDECSSSSSSMEVPVYSSRISQNRKFRQFSIRSWQKGAFLGSGSFGSVYEGYTDNGLFCAVKEVSLLDKGSHGQQSILQLEQEISLLSQFVHENIVQYFGTAKDEARLYIFLELVTKGSLLSLYGNYTIRDSQASSYTKQILNGLKYLHERNVVHRDIKCANILVHASGSVKLADFGLAKATISNDIKSCKGTAFWMAPEVVNSKDHGYGIAADVWSLGCTLLEMLTGQHPYPNLEWMQAIFKIGNGEPPPVPDSLSRKARDFICKCLQVNPDNRPAAAQLLEHSFVKRPQQAN